MGPESLHFSQILGQTDPRGQGTTLSSKSFANLCHFPNTPLLVSVIVTATLSSTVPLLQVRKKDQVMSSIFQIIIGSPRIQSQASQHPGHCRWTWLMILT